jgi:PAS domain-containing protein
VLSLTLRRVDDDFAVADLPNGWEDFLGVPLAEMEGMKMSVWLERFVHEDDLAPSQKAAGKLLRDASVVVGFVNRYKTPDGWAPLRWWAFAHKGEMHATAKPPRLLKRRGTSLEQALGAVQASAALTKAAASTLAGSDDE